MDLRTTTGCLAACGVIVSTLACGSTGPRPAGVRDVTSPPAQAAAVMAPAPVRAPQEPTEAEPTPPRDPADLLAASRTAYDAATVLWKAGALDDAFDTLDHAYTLMAAVPAEGEALAPGLAREKEDLRLRIGRRLVEIDASRRTGVGELGREIPRELNAEVRREIASFTGREREFFLESYRRSGLYRPMIVEELRRAGMPEELSWLPLVESGFKSRALSSARALGLWQFIPSTGHRYGLDRDEWIDERMDPEKATGAAIGYLTDLHSLFGDWLTALAAYNCGENAVLRRIREQPIAYFDRFWDLYERLPRETRRYVPRFLAVLAILEDPAAHGIELPEPYPPLGGDRFETVQVARAADLSALERAAGTSEGLLAELNPELRLRATPDAPYTLRVPAGTGEAVLAGLATVPTYAPPQPEVVTHRVRRGENLWSLASRYGTTIDHIRKANRLRGNTIHPGQQIVIPR